VWEFSPELRERYSGSGMQMISPVFECEQGKIRKYPWWHWKSPIQGLQYFDRINTSVAWVGIREKIKRDNPDISRKDLLERTAREAERVVNRTQNTTSIVDMSGIALESRKSVPFKILTAFQSQGNKNLNIIIRTYQQWRAGKISSAKAGAILSAVLIGNTIWVMAVNTVFHGIMKSLGGDDRDKKKANPVFIRNVAFQIIEENISNVYGGSNIIAPFVRLVRARLEGRPVTQAMKTGNLVGQTVDQSYQGVAEAAAALSTLYNQGPRKRVPLAVAHGVKSIEDSTRGILPLMFGVPAFPASILAKLARRITS